MPDSEPTLGEVMRRLDDVTQQFKDTVKDVREFRSWAERLYVPRGEWVEGRRADQGFVKDIKDDVDGLWRKDAENTRWKRQVIAGLLVATFSGMFSAVLTFAFLILGKGS